MILVSCDLGGIASRIFNLIYCIKLSKENNYSLMLYWDKDERFDYKFNDLFEEKISNITKEEIIRNLDNKEYLFIKDKYEKINEITKEEIIEILNSLKFKRSLNKKYDIGFHIRRGDYNDVGMARVSPTELFEEEMLMGKIDNKTMFLSSDDEVLKMKFLNRYGTSCFINNDFENYSFAKEDLENLSYCKKLYVSYGSSFNNLAWYLGGCKAERIVLYDKERLKEFQDKKEPFFQPLKRMLYRKLVPIEERFFKK